MNASKPNIKPALFFLAGITIVTISLCGCTGATKPVKITAPTAKASVTAEIIRISTPESTLKTTATLASAVAKQPTTVDVKPGKPTSTLDCVNALQFVADLTVPDGALIARGSQIDKRWRVKNTGTCNWDQRYSLVLIAGTELGVPAKQALIPARSGSEAVIRMILTSPLSPGNYTSAWQAFGPDGEPFGDVIYVQFQVN